VVCTAPWREATDSVFKAGENAPCHGRIVSAGVGGSTGSEFPDVWGRGHGAWSPGPLDVASSHAHSWFGLCALLAGAARHRTRCCDGHCADSDGCRSRAEPQSGDERGGRGLRGTDGLPAATAPRVLSSPWFFRSFVVSFFLSFVLSLVHRRHFGSWTGPTSRRTFEGQLQWFINLSNTEGRSTA
jgi:hypothetical protein